MPLHHRHPTSFGSRGSAGIAAALLPALLALPAAAQTSCSPIQFSGPRVTSLRSADSSTDTFLLRQLDGTFSSYRVQTAAPFAVLSSQPNALVSILPCGVPAPAGSPFGGAAALVSALSQTGAAGQPAAFALMSSTLGVMAYIDSKSGNVNVVKATASLPLQAQTVTGYNAGALVSALVFGDLNGDGIPDLVAADTGAATDLGGAVVFLANADGTLHPPTTFPAHGKPISVALADFNHDGKLDIAIANSSSGDVTVFLGKGDGTFFPAKNFLAIAKAVSLAAADLNGDGKLDLAIASSNGSFVSLLGNGDGTFQAPTLAWPAAPGLSYIALGDFNGDGIPDAALASRQNGTVSLALGRGDGSFSPVVTYPVAPQPSSLIVMDVNDDQKLDLLVATGNPFLIAGDRVSGDVSVLLGNGDGTLRSAALNNAGNQPVSVSAADFNRDHLLDIVTANSSSNDVSVLLAQPGGKFLTANSVPIGLSSAGLPSQPSAVLAVDINKDNKSDLVVADHGANDIAVLFGIGNGTFQSPIRFPTGNNPSAIITADFNGDTVPDLAIANFDNNGSGDVTIYIGAGGTLHLAPTLTAGTHPIQLASADFNKDGYADLAVVNSGTFGADLGGISLFLGNGDSTFQPAVNLTAGVDPTSLAVADFNLDGSPDIAVLSTNTTTGASRIDLLMGHGDGTFAPPVTVLPAPYAFALAATTLGPGGKPGLVLTHCCDLNSSAGYMAGNGDGTFQPEVLLPAGPSPQGLFLADFNGDKVPDILIADSGSAATAGTGAALLLLNVSPAAVATVNGASFVPGAAVAPASIASAFGPHLATSTVLPPPPLGTVVAGTTVTLTDSTGASRLCDIFFVSSGQVNFQIPPGSAPGPATVTVQAGDGSLATGALTLVPVAPGLFTANSDSLAAATLLRVHADGSQSVANMEQTDATGKVVPIPIDLDPSSDTVYLELYGTGIRGASQSSVSVQIGSQTLTPSFAGAQSAFVGLDQINVALPHSLKGSGDVSVIVSAAGHAANTVHVTIQ